MDNRDLFNFPFVNRLVEKDKVLSFLSVKEPDAVLWISGKSGHGKSRLLNHSLSEYDDKIIINREENESSEEYITKIIIELQKKAKFKFTDFLQENYSSIFDISKSATKTLVSIFLPEISSPLHIITKFFLIRGNC